MKEIKTKPSYKCFYKNITSHHLRLNILSQARGLDYAKQVACSIFKVYMLHLTTQMVKDKQCCQIAILLVFNLVGDLNVLRATSLQVYNI